MDPLFAPGALSLTFVDAAPLVRLRDGGVEVLLTQRAHRPTARSDVITPVGHHILTTHCATRLHALLAREIAKLNAGVVVELPSHR